MTRIIVGWELGVGELVPIYGIPIADLLNALEGALAIEARRATTTEIGVVHESAGPKDNAQNMSGPSHE